jgi:hypothetical protein
VVGAVHHEVAATAGNLKEERPVIYQYIIGEAVAGPARQ